MHTLRLIVICLCLTAVVWAAPSKLTATFLGVEIGDYVHLQVKAGNQERSFWITQDKSFTPFLETPEKFKGKRVELTWHTVKRNIPEAGGEMEIEEATSIRVLK